MNILQVSTFDTLGGAEKVAWNLFRTYRARGHRSWLAVGRKYSADPDVLLIPNGEARGKWFRFWWKIHERLRSQRQPAPSAGWLSDRARQIAEPQRLLDGYRGVENFRYPGTAQLLTLTPQRANILHAHNLHGEYFDLRLLPQLSAQVPFVLTLHDAWLLSGHCAHSFECERWKNGCGQCPDLTIDPAIPRDATAYNWQRKREIYARSQIYVATPSQWLMRKVEQSMLAPAVKETRIIANGVDLAVFHPADACAVRAALDIPQDAAVLLFAATALRHNMWKDYETVQSAIALVAERLPNRAVLFVALGEDAPAERINKAEVRFITYQTDPEVVARYYQAADAYVHAARADTFPNTVLEALACGTPVVATAVGGIPEQIEDTRTGFLVPVGDVAALAARLIQVLSDEALRHTLSQQATASVLQHFDLHRQVDTYLDWYQDLAARRAAVPVINNTHALPNPI